MSNSHIFLMLISVMPITQIRAMESDNDSDFLTRSPAQGTRVISCASSICPTNFACPTSSASTCTTNFACINVTNGATIGSLTTTCETITGNLTVGNNIAVTGDAIVENNTNIFGSACIQGSVQVGQNASIGGNEVLEGSLTVVSGAIVNGPLTVNGNETVNGSSVVTGNETVNQNLTVGGAGSVAGPLIANDGLSVFGGETINTGGLTIFSGGASITGDVTVNGDETVDNLDVIGSLTVAGNSFFNGCNTTVNGTLTTNGPVIMNKGLTIASGDETITSGNLTLTSGNLTVGGFSLFNGAITAANGAIVNNGLTVFGGETISSGNLTVANCSNVSIGGNLSVGGAVNGLSTATFSDLIITDIANSTSPTTGALVVNGGVGIGMDLWLGGSQYFNNVAVQGGVPSPLNYYEEACVPLIFEFNGVASATVTIQIVRIGNLVNLIVPILFFGPGTGVVTTLTQLPARFTPSCTIRGAASTIINDAPQLGEFEVDTLGNITFGLPGTIFGPQPFTSVSAVTVDINTITYNLLACGCAIT